jgi:ETC complex I subunit conserved region
MQSCMCHCKHECSDYICAPSCLIHERRWQNPLIGWTSTGDPMEHVARSALNFRSKEEAVAFAEKQGFNPVVREPQRRRPDRLKRYAGYGDNFRCCSAMRRRIIVLLLSWWCPFLHFCAGRQLAAGA